MTHRSSTDPKDARQSGARRVTSPTTGEPVKLFSREWFAGMALRYAMVIVMLLVIAYFSYRSARFGTVDNLITILVAAAPFALIALGQTLVILTGGIDLSVGSVIAVSAMAGAATAKANPGQVWMTVLRRDAGRAGGGLRQRIPGVAHQRSTVHRHAGHADCRLRVWRT